MACPVLVLGAMPAICAVPECDAVAVTGTHGFGFAHHKCSTPAKNVRRGELARDDRENHKAWLMVKAASGIAPGLRRTPSRERCKHQGRM